MPQRVVSLVPSATETLLAWGVEPIAVTRFCEQPTYPSVGGTKDPNLDAIEELAPDLVVMCVEENRVEDADALVARGLSVHAIDINRVAEVASELARLADAVGIDRGDLTMVDVPPPLPPSSRRAFVPIWRRPWMTISNNTYAWSMLDHLGIEVVLSDSPDRYPTVTDEEIRSGHPDVVIAPSEPYPFGERHRAELEAFAPVTFVDGQDLVWWGVRTPHALDRLATALNG